MTPASSDTGLTNLPSRSLPGGPDLPPFLYSVLGPKAAAEYLQVSETAVIEEAERGRLPGRKIGSDWRFLTLALADWLRAGPQPKPETKPLSSKERMLALAGAWKDDPTVDAMMEEIYRKRKEHTEPEPFAPVISSLPQSSPLDALDPKLAQEKAAFTRLLPGLLDQYSGQYAAVHDGQVIATGKNQMGVIKEALARTGGATIYVGLVTDQPQVPERIPCFRGPAGRVQK